jgi:hypothetical protein
MIPTATPTLFNQKLTITRDLLAFGNKTAVGNTSRSKSVPVKNAGKKKVLPVDIEMESSSPSVFVLKSRCEKMLVPGNSCKASSKPRDTTPRARKLMMYAT